MNSGKCFLLSIFSFLCFSCNGDTKIIFPDRVQNEIKQYIDEHKYLVIIYIELSQCTGCSLNNMTMWKGYKKTFEKYNTGVLEDKVRCGTDITCNDFLRQLGLI